MFTLIRRRVVGREVCGRISRICVVLWMKGLLMVVSGSEAIVVHKEGDARGERRGVCEQLVPRVVPGGERRTSG